MTLLEACEPLFQYVCRLNRSARKGVGLDIGQVRNEVKGALEEARMRAESAGLGDQFEKVRLPLIYFVDFMVKESQLDFARDWRELAHDENMFAGDEHFFDLLDETLADQGQQAAERLAVFFTCIGLGFTGFYTGQPEYLRKKMMEISARIRGMVEVSEQAKICPEAYEHVDTSNLVQPPGRSLLGIAIALVVLIVVLVAGNAWLYFNGGKALRANLDAISEKE